MPDLNEEVGRAEQTLKWLLEWVGRIDSRISTVLGLDTAMLGVLASLAPPSIVWTTPLVLLAASTVAVIAFSLLLLFLGAYPRLQGPSDSLIFFSAIAQYDMDGYATAFRAQSSEEHLKDLLGQCHRNAQIVERKFRDLKGAYQLSLIAIIPWTVTVIAFRTLR